MVTAFFNRREHLGGKHVHQKMSFGDNHPKNLVRSRQDEHHLLNLKFHVTAIPQLKLAVVVLYTHWNIPRSQVSCKIPQIVVAHRWKTTCRAGECMICGERTAADTVAWQVWWLPIVAKTHGIMESTLVECKTMITDRQD